MNPLEFPLQVYVDDDYRENFLKSKKNKKPKVVILDNNELSIACYMEDHPEFAEKIIKEIKNG